MERVWGESVGIVGKKSIFRTVRLDEENRRLIVEIKKMLWEEYKVEVSTSDVIRAAIRAYYEVLRGRGVKQKEKLVP